MLGLLKVKVLRGVNLAIRDSKASDPYVVIRQGRNKMKTRVVMKNINPEWNEDLIFSNIDTRYPLQIRVYDRDKFSSDDPMGEAEIDIKPFMDAVKMRFETIPSGTVIKKLIPSRSNCLAEETSVMWCDGRVTQDIVVRLKNVESGELELELSWVDISDSKEI